MIIIIFWLEMRQNWLKIFFKFQGSDAYPQFFVNFSLNWINLIKLYAFDNETNLPLTKFINQ